jgi:hypothetical protein
VVVQIAQVELVLVQRLVALVVQQVEHFADHQLQE